MSNAANLDADTIAQSGLVDAEHHGLPATMAKGSMDVRKHSLPSHDGSSEDEEWADKPTEEELFSLRRVSGPIMWSMWTIAFVELCERFSYYGSSVLYTNFVNHELPKGSNNGAPVGKNHPDYDENALPGALGQGPKAAQAISLVNQFFAYITPLMG